jgi:hypothetical protein
MLKAAAPNEIVAAELLQRRLVETSNSTRWTPASAAGLLPCTSKDIEAACVRSGHSFEIQAACCTMAST